MKLWLGPLLFFLGTVCPTPASAHALDPAYLELTAFGQDRWRVSWRVPDVRGRPMAIAAQLPAGCRQETPPPLAFDGRAWTSAWITRCENGLAGGVIAIDGLELTDTDALVRYEPLPGEIRMQRLTARQTSFAIPFAARSGDTFAEYTVLGITHILAGIDHLLFVFALLLLIEGSRKLFWAITAFTVAHSITLAAASLGVLRVPTPPVEAVIALSVVFLAYELCLSPEHRDPLTRRAPWLVAFAFGLVHGLGFAGALREIGLPEGDVPLALLAFNLGVEAGQLLCIAVVLAVQALALRLYPPFARATAPLRRASAYGIGSAAAFWVLERLASF
ncbi:MAG: HupE/UreJ family protein [Halieaceae bacterium]|nr:HupE/UreJ family protein [Halieaceae bacterium]